MHTQNIDPHIHMHTACNVHMCIQKNTYISDIFHLPLKIHFQSSWPEWTWFLAVVLSGFRLRKTPAENWIKKQWDQDYYSFGFVSENLPRAAWDCQLKITVPFKVAKSIELSLPPESSSCSLPQSSPSGDNSSKATVLAYIPCCSLTSTPLWIAAL